MVQRQAPTCLPTFDPSTMKPARSRAFPERAQVHSYAWRSSTWWTTSNEVWVVGNNAVHPAQIDLDADDEWLPTLFELVNLIVEQMITRPKRLQGLMSNLPLSVQAAIARRDGNGGA